MNGFSPEMQAKTKVNMWNMCREKHEVTRESLVLPGLLLLSNIETDRGYLGKRRACNNLRTEQTSFVKKNYQKCVRYQIHVQY